MSLIDSDAIQKLHTLLAKLIEKGGTDLHIKSGSDVRARIQGDIVLLSLETIEPETIQTLVKTLIGSDYEYFEKTKEFDSAYSLNEDHRFRVNIYMHLDGYALAFRLIPKEIKSVEALNLPSALHRLSRLQRGLVLITGTTGSGKSTTLASIIEEINTTYHKHIITIEDPIEYIHHDSKCIVEQRELGTHTNSFDSALRSVMREDPDVIVVGEMRDIATAESVLQAVNTGHLVFSTVHTLDAHETIDRLIAIFPVNEQNRIRATLASDLEAVISQRLIRGTSGKMIPAVEMMFKSPHIEELIRSKRDNEIPDAMSTEGTSFDSITFNQSLFDLALAGKITEEKAFEYATSISDLKLMFTTSSEYQSKIGGDISDTEDDIVIVEGRKKDYSPLVEPE